MRETHTIKINLPGGIVSPGDLQIILATAEKYGVKNVRFGNRQHMLFNINAEKLDDLKESFFIDDIEFEVDAEEYPNISSSYVTEEVFYTSNWLREGVYKDILDGFSHRPRLKINIVDYYQNLIPFFTGNLNFISSETSNFWYLYIRFPKTNIMYRWPSLVYSEDIPDLSNMVEKYVCAEPGRFYNQLEVDGDYLYKKVSANNKFLKQESAHPLIHTGFQLPYYEGFNKYSDNKLWLGIYRRNEEYSVSFLKEICDLCLQTRIGQLYTTAWKSIVVKNISTRDRRHWSNLLNKYRINVRHAANELNWQIEDMCEEAIELKLELVKQFEEADLRTYPLCFAIKTKPKTGLFGSVIIRKRETRTEDGEELFEVSYTRDFNPNSKDFIVFRQNVKRKHLAANLLDICDYYYNLKIGQHISDLPEKAEAPKMDQLATHAVYQCKHCLSLYDEVYGDEEQGIAPGTTFNSISVYSCPVCDAGKMEFSEVKMVRSEN